MMQSSKKRGFVTPFQLSQSQKSSSQSSDKSVSVTSDKTSAEQKEGASKTVKKQSTAKSTGADLPTGKIGKKHGHMAPTASSTGKASTDKMNPIREKSVTEGGSKPKLKSLGLGLSKPSAGDSNRKQHNSSGADDVHETMTSLVDELAVRDPGGAIEDAVKDASETGGLLSEPNLPEGTRLETLLESEPEMAVVSATEADTVLTDASTTGAVFLQPSHRRQDSSSRHQADESPDSDQHSSSSCSTDNGDSAAVGVTGEAGGAVKSGGAGRKRSVSTAGGRAAGSCAAVERMFQSPESMSAAGGSHNLQGLTSNRHLPPGQKRSQKERILRLQSRRTCGTWVQCSSAECCKWRHLSSVLDPSTLPKHWYCNMNPDLQRNSCSKTQQHIGSSHVPRLVAVRYTVGSLVWARLPGYPWWPAVVDDDPDVEEFFWLTGISDVPTHYNVTFLDSAEHAVTRAWITPQNLKSFCAGDTVATAGKTGRRWQEHRCRLERAVATACQALTQSIADRRRLYTFVAQYRGVWPVYSDSDAEVGRLSGHQNRQRRSKIKSAGRKRKQTGSRKEMTAIKSVRREASTVRAPSPTGSSTSGTGSDRAASITESMLDEAEELIKELTQSQSQSQSQSTAAGPDVMSPMATTKRWLFNEDSEPENPLVEALTAGRSIEGKKKGKNKRKIHHRESSQNIKAISQSKNKKAVPDRVELPSMYGTSASEKRKAMKRPFSKPAVQKRDSHETPKKQKKLVSDDATLDQIIAEVAGGHSEDAARGRSEEVGVDGAGSEEDSMVVEDGGCEEGASVRNIAVDGENGGCEESAPVENTAMDSADTNRSESNGSALKPPAEHHMSDSEELPQDRCGGDEEFKDPSGDPQEQEVVPNEFDHPAGSEVVPESPVLNARHTDDVMELPALRPDSSSDHPDQLMSSELVTQPPLRPETADWTAEFAQPLSQQDLFSDPAACDGEDSDPFDNDED